MEQVDVAIVGAGPAGSAAALALGRTGARVRVFDRLHPGRARLCGEFVSGEAAHDLGALGIDLEALGARTIGSAAIAAGGARAVQVRLAPAGRGISRAVLDAHLAARAAAAGAVFCFGSRVESVEGDARAGFRIRVGDETLAARFVIDASGKRAGRDPAVAAVKVHVADRAGRSALTLHAFAGGYLGVAPVEGGRANVCLVAQRLPAHRGGALGALRTVAAGIPALRDLVDARVVEDATCAESGLRFGGARPVAGGVLRCGDAAALPHPVCGDGIAMALRSGRMAAAHVAAVLGGTLQAAALEATYACAWRREFAARLHWSGVLHAALVRPRTAAWLLRTAALRPEFAAALVARTRGGVPAPTLVEG